MLAIPLTNPFDYPLAVAQFKPVLWPQRIQVKASLSAPTQTTTILLLNVGAPTL